MTRFYGMEHSEGDMVDKESGEVIAWDNYLLYFLTDSPDAFGMICMTHKIKADQFKAIVGLTPEKLIEEMELRSGSEVILSYVPKRDRMILSGIRWCDF